MNNFSNVGTRKSLSAKVWSNHPSLTLSSMKLNDFGISYVIFRLMSFSLSVGPLDGVMGLIGAGVTVVE